MPNTSGHKRIQEYAVSVNDLEDIIGIDIFTNIDDRFEEMVESDIYFNSDMQELSGLDLCSHDAMADVRMMAEVWIKLF